MNQEEFEKLRKSKNFCHVYSAQQWHDNAYIVADKQGLLRIKRVIEKALEVNRSCCTLRPNDDETYQLHVLKVDDVDIQNKLVLPYLDSWAVGNTDNTIHPFQLIDNPKYKL